MELEFALICSSAHNARTFPAERDIPLSKRERRAFEQAAKEGAYPPAARVYTDISARSIELASVIYHMPAVVLPDMAGYDYGGLEDMPYGNAIDTGRFCAWAAAPSAAGFGDAAPPYFTQANNIRAFLDVAEKLQNRRDFSAALITRKEVIMTIVNRFNMPAFFYFYEEPRCGEGYLSTFDTETGIMQIKKRLNYSVKSLDKS